MVTDIQLGVQTGSLGGQQEPLHLPSAAGRLHSASIQALDFAQYAFENLLGVIGERNKLSCKVGSTKTENQVGKDHILSRTPGGNLMEPVRETARLASKADLLALRSQIADLTAKVDSLTTENEDHLAPRHSAIKTKSSRNGDSPLHDVTVVGGGLAGMVAALRLLQRGCAVDIYEASDRLGGKAGTGLHSERTDDHGYHIFPMWYRNIWKLVDELAIGKSFIDCDGFMQLSAGQYPDGPSYRNLTSMRYVFRNLFAGVTPIPHTFLFFYAALDLMSQPYSYRAALDRVTVSGFLRSRPYRTEKISDQFEELMLKGISVPTYQVSAMTMRNVMRYWFHYPEPMLRILDGSLYDKWIVPLQHQIEQLGGRLHFDHRLERLEIHDNTLSKLHFQRSGAGPTAITVSRTILAIPCEKLWPLLDDSVLATVPELAKTRYLRSLPMAALNLYFDRRIPRMPRGHINLVGSNYALSFIDVSQFWSELEGSVLQVIASDFTPLSSASPDYAERCIVEELARWIPLGDATIVRSNFLAHLDEPLFMNDVGAWANRPDAATSLPNLYLAGDYCRSAIDLVSMEGAVSTGLLAAEAVRRDAEIAEPVDILVPDILPPWLFELGMLVLFPLAMAARIWVSLTDRKDATESSATARAAREPVAAHAGAASPERARAEFVTQGRTRRPVHDPRARSQ